ncbi:MAG: hypothetical protein ABJN36_07100 [Cyclobacteriaceae bacterium]
MRFFTALLIFLTAFTACKDKVICPAFQSTYILDDSVRLAYYSYLWKLDEAERTKYLANLNKPSQPTIVANLSLEDTTSQIVSQPDDVDSTATLTASIGDTPTVTPVTKKTDYFAYAGQYVVPTKEVKKNKYGIIRHQPYLWKLYRMKTAPMENVLTPPKPQPDPIMVQDTTPVDVGEIYVSDFGDSLATDSTAVVLADADTSNVSRQDIVLPSLAHSASAESRKVETKYLYRYDPKDKALNVEQDYYNKYFGEYLIQKPPKPKPKPVEEVLTDSLRLEAGANGLAPSEGDSTSGGGFLKKRKRRKTTDDESLEEGTFPDESATESETIEEEEPVSDEPQTEEPKKKEPTEDPEDDGF